MDGFGVINKLAGGHLIEDLNRALVEVAELVIAREKPGTVTVTFRIAPVADMPAVTVGESIKQMSPGPKTKGALFFALDGALHSSDPRQPMMPFRLVEDKNTGVRTLTDEVSDIREVE